jgi:hypothetical protein
MVANRLAAGASSSRPIARSAGKGLTRGVDRGGDTRVGIGMRYLRAAGLAACLLARAAGATPPPPSLKIAARDAVDRPAYAAIARRVAAMVSDPAATGEVSRHGLDLVNVMWEDTGRWEGSSVGPNISDVTIEVEAKGAGGEVATFLMPVIRHANFSDKTADVRLDKINLPVGNARGHTLRTISLKDFLAEPSAYLGGQGKGTIKGGSLLRAGDVHALVSAQHAFLPVPQGGSATFHPVIFNYASSAGNPAVLTLLVTRQGTSATIIDNARDTVTGGASWGQRLYFDQDGKRAPLTAERLADVKASGHTANGEAASSLGADANLLMLIQIPLKHREAPRMQMEGEVASAVAPSAMAAGSGGATRGARDLDVAVLGHGPTQGPFTELDGMTIERDPKFPVRVTVQFYQATASGEVAAADVAHMAQQIDKVYASADYVGSLVVPTPRDRQRDTHWAGAGDAPKVITIDMFPGLRERIASYGWWSVPYAVAQGGRVIKP